MKKRYKEIRRNIILGIDREYYLKELDFIEWYRYFFVIREVIDYHPERILEIGSGNGLVKNCLSPLVDSYQVIDANPIMAPDIYADVREFVSDLKEGFDCIISTNVLEHIPFQDVLGACRNLYSYLVSGGKALITIPHRRSDFLYMTPVSTGRFPNLVSVSNGFLSPGGFFRRFIKRKIWIDPGHCWEVGDGTIKTGDVELVFEKAGFTVAKFKKLLYVDFWVLHRA